jgi:retinol dehydrogenase 12
MKRLASEIANREPPIDILINNAGALFGTRRLTEDGLEYTFALNHMSYFVVTEGLRERLLASGGARIINTASAAHQGATLDFDDLQSAKNFRAMRAYGRSKLCNILFTRQLARSLQGTNITANCYTLVLLLHVSRMKAVV